MTKPKEGRPCDWCGGTGWIIIRKRGQIVRSERCNNCRGTGTK